MCCAYDADDCKVLSQALDKAWEIYLRTGRLSAMNIDVAKAALCYALLEAAVKGERNINRLAMAAVGRMPKYEGQLRDARSYKVPASPRRASA